MALTNPRKEGDSLVTGTPAGAAAGTVRAGALESSGADAARSMVDMIASMRAFEAGQKVIQTIDETLGQAVDQGRRRRRLSSADLKSRASQAEDPE